MALPMDLFGGAGGAPDPMDSLGIGSAAEVSPMDALQMPTPSADPQIDLSNLALSQNTAGEEEKPKPIDKLKPDSDLHRKVREKLDAMLKYSQQEMQKNHNRWNFMERKVQAFVHDQDYQQLMDNLENSKGAPPEPINIVVPYTYATLHAAATYIGTILLGRRPLFPLMGTRGTMADNARHMEMALQQNVDASGGLETGWQHIWDTLLYSFGCFRIGWEERRGPVMKMQGGQRVFDTGLTYAGNVLTAVDPYDCFPDPRVPLHKCPQKGDFIFTRLNVSETVLKDQEKAGTLKWVKEAVATLAAHSSRDTSDVVVSQRRSRINLDGKTQPAPQNVVGFRAPFEGTVRLVPKDWGLGDSDTSELWKFTWFQNGQIMQAEPLGMLHGMHPYALSEPTSLGYDFMSLSQAEMISVFQDILSWLVSSRMENVRSAINNSFIADPARVELNDIRSTTIGRIIRMKQSAMGLPINDAIKQLQVTDVTGGHLNDIQTMRMLADSATGVNDNLRGIQTQGGRRSATEARMSMQAGAGRLSQLAIRISSQGLMPAAQQMIMNIQQLMPEEMWVEMTGDEGGQESKQLTPDMLMGSFNFQISDGTLPLDKMALTETWKEILFGIARDPELRQKYDLGKIFNYVAELGGARNIQSFQRTTPEIAPPGVDPGTQPGATPVGAAVPAMPASLAFQGA